MASAMKAAYAPASAAPCLLIVTIAAFLCPRAVSFVPSPSITAAAPFERNRPCTIDGFAVVGLIDGKTRQRTAKMHGVSLQASANDIAAEEGQGSRCGPRSSDGDNDDKGGTHRRKPRTLYSFAEARRIARGHGFESRQEFVEYTCPGAYQVPKNPNVVWIDDWQGWDDFLGITLSFDEGRDVARALDGVSTEQEYLTLLESKTIPDESKASRLPYRPDLKYKDQWQGWDDWLGESS